MITKEETLTLVQKFGKSEKDCGSTSVQIAILTTRINNLAEHFGKNKQDFHSQRGLMQMIGKRRSLLRYLAKVDGAGYQKLIQELGIRK